MAEKRKRGQNFTLEDKDKLIKLLLQHKETILNKRTDGATNESKNSAWIAITDSFNATSNTYRNKESLMKMWEKLKSESKKYYSQIKNNSIQTGGGPSVTKIDPVLEQVCSILGRGCTGILGVPDCDAEISTDTENVHVKVICTQNDIWQAEEDIITIEEPKNIETLEGIQILSTTPLLDKSQPYDNEVEEPKANSLFYVAMKSKPIRHISEESFGMKLGEVKSENSKFDAITTNESFRRLFYCQTSITETIKRNKYDFYYHS